MVERECSTTCAVKGIDIALEEICGGDINYDDLHHPSTVGRWRGAISYVINAMNAIIYAGMDGSTLCRDGSDTAGQFLNDGSLRGSDSAFTTRTWHQATKGAVDTHQWTMNILDK